jgi:F0F1-type ATP synthase alpha subunit
VIAWEENFHRFMETNHPEIANKINTEYEIKADTDNLFKAAITQFKQGTTL